MHRNGMVWGPATSFWPLANEKLVSSRSFGFFGSNASTEYVKNRDDNCHAMNARTVQILSTKTGQGNGARGFMRLLAYQTLSYHEEYQNSPHHYFHESFPSITINAGFSDDATSVFA